MSKLYNYPLNVQRCLNIIIQNPKTIYSYEDFKSIRERYTTYARVMEALNFVKKEGIFKEPKLLGKAKAKSNLYELSNNLTSFRKIYQNYKTRKEIKMFFESEYIDYILNKSHFMMLYKAVERDLNDPKIRKIFSKSVLNKLETIEEYSNLAESLRKEISRVSSDDLSTRSDIDNKFIEPIKILNNLTPIEAINLYRKTFHMAILEEYKNLALQGIINEGLHSFIAFDTYMSPLTSFPIRDLRSLLLLPNPFQRIYEDIYLLDGEAFALLTSRAAAIYYHFSEIVFELVKDEPFNERQLRAFTRQMIFYWNVASTRFDLVCFQLAPFYDSNEEPHSFNVKIEGDRIIIIDLVKERTVLSLGISEEMLSLSSNPRIFRDLKRNELRTEIMTNAFDRLRPCQPFGDMGFKLEIITLDDIFSGLDERLQENINENVNRSLSFLKDLNE